MKFIAGLRVWGNRGMGKTPQVFPRLRGSANRRVDLHLPLIASIRGAVGQHDLPQFQAGKLPRLTPEAVQAIALVEVLREQLRSQLGPFIDERPHALGILPNSVVLLADHAE